MNASVERREVLFRGRVQGVGFRYTTRQIAQQYRVSGYVQNMADGRVRAVIEGTPGEIDRFLAAVESNLGRYIRGKEESAMMPIGEAGTFEIRF